MIAFQLRCESQRSEYVEVRLYPSIRLMRRAIRRHDLSWGQRRLAPDPYRHCEGLTRTETVLDFKQGRNRARVLPRLGWVFLAETHAGSGHVSHEMTHVALYFARRARLRIRQILPAPDSHWRPDHFVSEDAERFCYVVGRLTAGFYDELYRRRIVTRIRRNRDGKSRV